jgi:predicted nucleotide-binding protein
MMAEKDDPVGEILPGGLAFPESSQTGLVCITYGRHLVMNKQVVSVIKDLGIKPLVMQDKKYAEKPLAEFVAAHPDIQFVVAILSADDWVYPKEGKPKDAVLRADQLVVFHLGYWIGKLGRERVFVLYYDQRSFQWPTKFMDLIYTPLDKGGLWQKELIRRLKQFGLLGTL